MRALVTNDDGIDSAGLHALAGAARDCGLDVVVAAPSQEASGTSASLSAAEPGPGVIVEERELAMDGVPAYAVAAHPAFIVMAAAEEAFGPRPDVVLSGINLGANVGRAVLHSGTVGAALTGGLQGAQAMAVSIDSEVGPEARPHWSTAAAVTTAVLPRLLEAPAGIVVNLNVPDQPVAELGELRRARLTNVGAVQSHFERRDGRLYRAMLAATGKPEPDTDVAGLVAGHPTLTELDSVRDVEQGYLSDLLERGRG